jgi:hypothetical protein
MGVLLAIFDWIRRALRASMAATHPTINPRVPRILRTLDKKPSLIPVCSAGPSGLMTAKKTYDSPTISNQATTDINIRA